jgi:hypothetical protein
MGPAAEGEVLRRGGAVRRAWRSTGRLLVQVAAVAAVIELFTCFTRFVLGLRAVDHAHLLARYSFGIRLHHGYTGLLLALAAGAWMLARGGRAGPWLRGLLTFGLAMALSDVVHHFVVLWAVTGSPEFP